MYLLAGPPSEFEEEEERREKAPPVELLEALVRPAAALSRTLALQATQPDGRPGFYLL